jgi:RNA polymerase sigma factor (sigma-70 family)
MRPGGGSWDRRRVETTTDQQPGSRTGQPRPSLPMGIDEIVRQYGPLVTGVARGVGLSRHEAEDVAQTVWMRLLTKGDTIRDPACLPGWLKTCARREAQRTSKLRQRSVLSDRVGEGAATTADDPEWSLLRAESRRCVATALQALTCRQRDVLTLVAEGCSYGETSRRTGVPVPSIGPTMQRGLKAMGRMAVIVRLAHDPESSAAMASASC